MTVAADPALATFQQIASQSGLPLNVTKAIRMDGTTTTYRLLCSLQGKCFSTTGVWTGHQGETLIDMPRLIVGGDGQFSLSYDAQRN